jgi:class 3 adenylate cyclase/tetratricopeptide (TPR) repeat protein
VATITEWLASLGMSEYAQRFGENDIDVSVLHHLTDQDLKELGVSLGHRRKMLAAIAERDHAAPVTRQPVTAVPPWPAADAERRQVTVMFCDLVGSTALSTRLDPEDLRGAISAYHKCVAETVSRFEGFVAKYMGDGVVIYFGYPRAHEDDAEQAVRASLALVAAVSQLQASGPMQLRIGIATGVVVVGDLIGQGSAQEQAIVGETPNLAARLQALAEPNTIVIAENTRRQIGALFDLADLGPQSLKGFAEPQRAWRVLSENRALGRFEALRSGATVLVGREEELGLLLRRWSQAKAGGGRVALISGEPGVGKSRIAQAMVEHVAGEPHICLHYFCSPHHQDSALYPVIVQMERAASFLHGDTPGDKLAKLQAVLAATARAMEDVALLAELHGLPSTNFAPPLDVTPQRKKEKTFEALLRRVEGLSRQQPVLMVFEDIHWMDPSSRELLDRTIERLRNWPVLLLGTFRPEFQPPWIGQPHVTMLALARLDARNTAAMVANIDSRGTLPQEIIEEIAERTDGVPLFVEELTKAVLESGPESAAALSSVPSLVLSVPATLHASLMARLDRLGPAAKDVAQIGAAIGREFGYELLAPIADLGEPQLREVLDRLTSSGLLFARGVPPQSTYTFKHALVRDAAYGTLLRSRRQRLHARIAATLEERFPELVLTQPELLALHSTEAGLAEKAVVYRLQAGQQALARSTMTEAVAQLRKGLDVLAGLPDGSWRRQQELDLQAALGSALTATKGWSAVDVSETFSRARALAEQMNRPEYLVRLITGQYTFHFVRAEHSLTLPLAEQLEKTGEARKDAAAQLLGRSCRGMSHFMFGEFVAARHALERCLALADPAHRTVEGLPFDPYTLNLTWLALTLAYLGYIDQARSRMNEAVAEARRLGHAHSLAHALTFSSWLGWLTDTPMEHVDEVVTLTREHGFPHYLGWALAYRGKSLVAVGKAQEGLALLTQALDVLRATGNGVSMPMLYTWLAEAYAALGQLEEEQRWFDEMAQLIETTEERVSEAELLHRVRGDLLNLRGDRAGAERWYREAIAIAKQQSANFLRLRASTSLARLWRDQGKRAEARDMLAPIYGWFTEGLDTPVPKGAKALLDELAS